MEGSPAERDVLLATKLQVPRSRPGLVPRRRLAGRLEEGLNRGLVLVAAPAGYGKSVLLSEWVQGMQQAVARKANLIVLQGAPPPQLLERRAGLASDETRGR